MSPWDIVGWILVIILGIPLLVTFLSVLLAVVGATFNVFKNAYLYLRYVALRDIEPAEGQVWKSNLTGEVKEIVDINDYYVFWGSGTNLLNKENWDKTVMRKRMVKVKK